MSQTNVEHRQSPVLFNPGNVDISGKPWGESRVVGEELRQLGLTRLNSTRKWAVLLSIAIFDETPDCNLETFELPMGDVNIRQARIDGVEHVERRRVEGGGAQVARHFVRFLDDDGRDAEAGEAKRGHQPDRAGADDEDAVVCAQGLFQKWEDNGWRAALVADFQK